MRILIFALMTTMMAFAAPDRGQDEFKTAGIEPIVQPRIFQMLLMDLGLSEAQREMASLLLEDYGVSMREVLESLRSQQSQDRELLDAALSGRMRLNPEQLRDVRIRLRTSAANACKTADARVDELVEWATLLATVDDAQRQIAVGRFHRNLYLDLRHGEALVDIERVALASEDIVGMDQAILDQTMQGYRAAMASRARSDAQACREARFSDGVAAIQNRDAERIDVQRTLADRWLSRMLVQDAAIEAISASLPPESATQWQKEAEAAMFPQVHRRIDAVRVVEWIANHGSEAQRSNAKACLADRLDQLNALRSQATKLLRDGRAAGVDLHHDAASLVQSTTALRMKFLQNSGARSMLEQDMLECVQRLLTEGQRAAVRRFLLTGS